MYPTNDLLKIPSIDAAIVSISAPMISAFSLFTYTMNLGLVHNDIVILLIKSNMIY